MKVYFDNCTSPIMAKTLGGYLSNTEIEVFHARDLGLQNKPDIEWITRLGATGEDWLVVTGDGKIRKNRAEREAYRRANMKGIVLAAAYQKTPMGKCCGIVIANWDNVLEFSAKLQAPYLIEISINLSSKYKVLPL